MGCFLGAAPYAHPLGPATVHGINLRSADLLQNQTPANLSRSHTVIEATPTPGDPQAF